MSSNDFKDHLPNCEYQDVPCSNTGCIERIPKNKLQKHKNEACLYKPTRCQHCGQCVPEAAMEAHFNTCTKFPMTCEECGMSNILRDDLQHHIQQECQEAVKPCKFHYAGCSFRYVFVGGETAMFTLEYFTEAKEDLMNEHDQSQKSEHLNLIMEYTSSKEQKERDLTQKLDNVEQHNNSLQSQLATHRETLAAATQDLRSYQTRLGKVEQTVADHRRDIGQIRERLDDSASASPGKNNEYAFQFEEVRTALTEQEVKLSALESELARGSISGPRSMGGGSLTLDRRLGRNEHQLALHDIQLAEHDLKIQMLEATSYDGTYIWKIDEFSRRHHDAIIGKTPSIYSPPFYVGRYGYKVCARVYSNGDGMGKGTYLSLFFVIMKGEYDAIIPWPFRQKVTFKLLDQDRQNDISDTFKPDPNSSSFKRPTSNMNIASGCPLFITQQDLQKRSYVSDDTMFIKISVETSGLPPLGF
ncbi:hypothetical protein QZH41_012458 [Actinostola sp. cb2023]|nr:hypothetical protein QZH41_012458 [Actinostola sp. cb2023]